MRRWFLVVLALAACKGKEPPKHDETGSAAPVPVDWKACDAALKSAASAPLDARPQIVIDGCKVCGDWKPLLSWATRPEDGGPKRPDIDAAMQRCGYCDGNAKQRFLGTLDNARGTESRAPWRQLGDICKDKVSAVPDGRFVSAPYYALDRIARQAAARGGETAHLLAALELPLPAMSVAGTGVVLPELDGGVSPKIGTLAITVLGDSVFVGRLPRAKLGAVGVTVDLGPDGYPGAQVKLADLGAALGVLVGKDQTTTVTLLAPHAMPAEKLVPIIAAASTVAPLYLAAAAHESPEGWQLPGAIPVALETGGSGAIVVTAEMTVQNLASELAKKAAQNLNRVGVSSR
ncbi:MAG TPA: hypothetical protein VLB44_23720 [Kofleriaceae bacterium]|nr:hypothetical protein [Kofleriaceae bacterium]